MKKIFAILLAVTMLASMATVVSAAENTTTLTTTVPAASYTLNIPTEIKVDFGAKSTDFGKITVTNSSGFAVGKNLNVTVTYGAFECENVTTTIPFAFKGWNSEAFQAPQFCTVDLPSGSYITFYGKSDTTVGESAEASFGFNTGGSTKQEMADIENYTVNISSDDWGKALAGEYTATITFTAEVVVEQ